MTIPYINWGDIAKYEFALPPKDEQRRIAEILWAAVAVVDHYHDGRGALQKCHEAMTSVLLGEDTVAVTVERLSSRETARLGDVADVAYGLTVNASRREMTLEKPYLRVANVHRDRLELAELKTIGCTVGDIENFQLEIGDVLVVEGHANIEEIGRAATWRGEVDECLHQNHILRVRCGNNLLPEYLTAYLNSGSGIEYIRKHAKSTSGLNTINSRVLKECLVPLPALTKQQRVVGLLHAISNQEKNLAEHVENSVLIKQQLLARLLSPQLSAAKTEVISVH